MNISFESANTLMAEFEKSGLVKEMTGFAKNRSFRLDEYLTLFEH